MTTFGRGVADPDDGGPKRRSDRTRDGDREKAVEGDSRAVVSGAPAGGPPVFDTAPASHKASYLPMQFAFAMHASFA